MRAELLEQLPLVEQSVHEVGVVMQRITQTGVYDLQQHADHLLDHTEVLCLGREREKMETKGTEREKESERKQRTHRQTGTKIKNVRKE